MDYNYQPASCEFDEFITKGICAANPNISALQETIIIYLKELAYYLLVLKDFGATNEVLKETVIEAISGLITNIDYNPEHFQKLVYSLVNNLSQAKTLYGNICIKNNTDAKFLKTSLKLPKEFDINEIIKRGERYYVRRNTEYTAEQKNLFEIILVLIKNICLLTMQFKSFNKEDHEYYETLLILLNLLNSEAENIKSVKSVIDKSITQYHQLAKALYNAQEERYGQRESVYIPFSPRTGKAILVSGIDLTQLEKVLEATKNKGIDVYTHGMTMLMAHTLLKFRQYPHLVGHFGKGGENSLFDFAAFPGAVLMTRYLFQKVDYLFRGRLFTTDSFAPSGIIKIKNDDFEPLIKAALQAKGFNKDQQEVILRVGFRQKLMEDKVTELVEKMNKNQIKHIYFIGILNQDNGFKEYFDKFLELMPKDCYAITLAHEKNEENILHVDSFYDYQLIYKVLEKFNEKKPLNELKITLFITKCDSYTITNIMNFINMGVKSIYLCQCSPILINPALAEAVRKHFGIKDFSTPEEDLKNTLAE